MEAVDPFAAEFVSCTNFKLFVLESMGAVVTGLTSSTTVADNITTVWTLK